VVLSTKAQIRLMETTMVLFVFFFILMIGIGVYSNVQTNKLEQLDRKFNQQEAIEQARNVLNLNEISCSNSGVSNNNCFDVEKLPGFRRLVRENPLYYQEIFGSSRATLILPSTSYPVGNFLSPDFFNVNDGDDPDIAFGVMPWETNDYDNDGREDTVYCTCGSFTGTVDHGCIAPGNTCNVDDNDDDDSSNDYDDDERIQLSEEAQLLFDFSGNLENKQTFHFPISLWDARYVPEKSYFGWIIIEVYS